MLAHPAALPQLVRSAIQQGRELRSLPLVGDAKSCRHSRLYGVLIERGHEHDLGAPADERDGSGPSGRGVGEESTAVVIARG